MTDTSTSAFTATASSASASSLSRDPISLILPFLSLPQLVTSAAVISRLWYSTAQTMRPHENEWTIKYHEANFFSHQQLLFTSSLRHLVTHLTVEMFSLPTVIATYKAAQEVAHGKPVAEGVAAKEVIFTAAARHLPSHCEQLMRLNTVSEAMSHLTSLEVHFVFIPGDNTNHEMTTEMLKFSPRLRQLKLRTRRHQPGPKDEVSAWLERLFAGVTSSKTLCQSLQILESQVTPSGTPYPNSIVTALHTFHQLRRLEIASEFWTVNKEFMDAIRAIPQLSEIEGHMRMNMDYLLRSPCRQAYRRLGGSTFLSNVGSSLFSDYFTTFGLPSGEQDTSRFSPELLLASSANSLIDLSATLLMSPSFLPQFTRLRSLNLKCMQEKALNILVPATYDAEDVVKAVSQCLLLEHLLIWWLMEGSPLTDSHLERMVTPLDRLTCLLLNVRWEYQLSLSFLTKVPHLASRLRYFIFEGRLTSLVDSRSIYCLDELRVLCIEVRTGDGVTHAALDTMFRPHHQVRASYFAHHMVQEAELKGPGELPQEYCSNLQHFTQAHQRIKTLQVWQDMIAQLEKKREIELLRLPFKGH